VSEHDDFEGFPGGVIVFLFGCLIGAAVVMVVIMLVSLLPRFGEGVLPSVAVAICGVMLAGFATIFLAVYRNIRGKKNDHD
jgi:chromate transport protein ChrA